MKSKLHLKKFLMYELETGIFRTLINMLPAGKIDADGYTYIWVDRNKYRADRLACRYVNGEWPKHPVIHIDGVNSNDSWSNLKIAPVKKVLKNNTSKITGVHWSKGDKRYIVLIYVKGKQKYMGSYKIKDMAVLVRYKAEVLYGYEPGSTAHQYIKKMFL